MSLTRFATRLPTPLVARVLLALLFVCNLTLCIGWHGAPLGAGDIPAAQGLQQLAPIDHQGTIDHQGAGDHQQMSHANMSQPESEMAPSCHQRSDAATTDHCQMQSGISGGASLLPLLGVLIPLFVLPLLLFAYLRAPRQRCDHWLRDPFLRSRAAHPPSWPRRHLMLLVLRH